MMTLLRRSAAVLVSTPLGRNGLIALIGASVVLASIGLGLRWDPFDFQARRLAKAQDQATRATSDATARTLEVEGERRQVARVQAHADTLIATDRATARVVAQTQEDHDLRHTLDPARAARLRAHDNELCRIAPHLAGCPASPDIAGGGDPPLRPDCPD